MSDLQSRELSCIGRISRGIIALGRLQAYLVRGKRCAWVKYSHYTSLGYSTPVGGITLTFEDLCGYRDEL